jgi:hypothetical protein
MQAEARWVVLKELDTAKRNQSHTYNNCGPPDSAVAITMLQCNCQHQVPGPESVGRFGTLTLICLLCGSTSHIATACNKPNIATHNDKGGWSIAGKVFCHCFNGSKGCTYAK